MKAVLAEHKKWIDGEGGSRANLYGANLKGANLQGANLQGANLQGAYLDGAYLYGANLYGANLEGANLYGANLKGANLQGANLKGANLKGANLKGANLQGAYLDEKTVLPAFQICEGDLIVYKKIQGRIVTLAIPKDAKRTASIIGRKCRAEYALVLDIEGHSSVASDGCGHGPSTTYEEGKEVRPDSYDDDWRVECSHGIHFFLTRKEAEDWAY
jgi:hypothetical protein